MLDCGCTHEAPCECEECQEKDALIRILYSTAGSTSSRMP